MRKLALLTVLVMMFGVLASACMTSAPPAGNADTNTAVAADTAAPAATDAAAAENTDPMMKYDPPIELDFARPYDTNSDNYQLLTSKFNETLDDNRWTRYFKDQFGIIIKNTFVAQGGDQYNQKFKLAMASDGLPPYLNVASISDLKDLVDAGKAVEIGPYYEKYASPLMKSITEAEGKNIFDFASFNAKIYGIPMKGTSTDGYNHLWIRQDWLDKLNLQRPKTMDDVLNIARAFKDKDPDGNGQNDSLGMELDKDYVWQSKGIFWAFGGYTNGPAQWLKASDGTLVYANVQPEMKKGLAFIKQMYDEGLIDKEFATKTFDQSFEAAVNGKCGMFYGPHWNAWPIDNVVKNDPKAKWVVVPLPTENGDTAKIPMTVSYMNIAAATTKAQNPEALVRVCNVIVDKLFGPNPDGTFWADGGYEFWSLCPIYILDTMVDLQSHIDIKNALANGTTDKLTGSAKLYYDFMQQGMYPWTLMFSTPDTPFDYVEATYPQQVIWNGFNSSPTETMAARWTNMEELLSTSYVKMITGDLDLDSGFDSMVQQWKAMGGDQVTQEVNDVVKQNQANK